MRVIIASGHGATTRRGRPLLSIETSNIACSVALRLESSCKLAHEVIPRGHHERLPQMIGELLSDAGLTGAELGAVAFGRGPGSFTGVRLAAATAQAWSIAHELPVHAVSSLAALALEAGQKAAGACRIVPVVRARPGEFYTADFDWKDGALSRLSEDRRSAMGEVRFSRARGLKHLMVGDACQDLALDEWELDSALLASAQSVSVLASLVAPVPAQGALPVYLQPDASW